MRAASAPRFTTTILFQLIWSLAVVSAFSFTFSSDPTQCSSLTVNVKGGTAPYRLNLIPAGPLPRGGPEIRTIVDQVFSDRTFKLDALKFPADSQFIAMLSDATGVGTGGTSAILTVSDSNNTSCLSTEATQVQFYFFLNPDTISLCRPVNISWDAPQGDVTLAGVIPGGQSFQIPVTSGVSSVTWLPQIEPGTSIFILAGDSRGRASGGSSSARTVASGSRTCLNGGAYSSTQSPYAGQVSATSPPESLNNGGGIKRPLLIGIVVGLLALFALAGALLYLRYRKRRPTRHNKHVDLFRNDDDAHDELANGLEPTPFLPPPLIRDPDRASGRGSFESSRYRYSSSTFQSGLPHTSIGYSSPNYHDQPPSSYVSHGVLSPPLTASSNTWDDSHTDTGTHTTSLFDSGRPQAAAGFSVVNPDGRGPVSGGSGWGESRKQPLPRARPVNFLQHQDAGTVEPVVHEEAELVELPPSYADVGRSIMGSPPPAPAAATPPP